MKDEYDYDDAGLNSDPTTVGGRVTLYLLQAFVGVSVVGGMFVWAYLTLLFFDVI